MKQEIENLLLTSNFVKKDNTFVKIIEQVVSQIVINGVPHAKKEKIEIKFEYVGDGWVGNSEEDSLLLTQWKLTIGNEEHDEFLIHDKYEFEDIFKKILEYGKENN